MASDAAAGGRRAGKRAAETGFQWVTSSPSPAAVARLEEAFPEVVRIPLPELEAEAASWLSSAIIARTYSKWVPTDALIREFRRAGIPGEINPLSLAFRCHIIRFDSPQARDLVLQRPWVVNGQVVGTEAWRPEFLPAEDAIPNALVWVRLPNLPLEFWKEEFIRTILEPAGVFIAIDAATKGKNRGAFARACLRIDLRCPLRPGVRLQGFNLPFWQPIIYENIEGVCMSCGALHLGGSVSHPVCLSSAVPSQDSGFGPWLVAVRQRKGALRSHQVANGKDQLKSPSDASNSSPGSQSGEAVPKSSDSWVNPGKTARRRQSPAVKVGSGPAVVLGSSRSASGRPVIREESVPVLFDGAGTVHSELLQQELAKEGLLRNVQTSNLIPQSANPFAVLASAESVDVQPSMKDASAAPLKRARSEATLPPRSVSKMEKRKGKAKVLNSKFAGKLNCDPIQKTLPSYEPIQLEGGDGSTSKSAASGFQGLDPEPFPSKLSSQSSGTADVMDGHLASSSLASNVDTLPGGGFADSVMLEDQGGVPVSPNL